MRIDRERGKRNNWLLIKHRDGYERKDDGETVLDQDTSVASGRTMDQIAAGKEAQAIHDRRAKGPRCARPLTLEPPDRKSSPLRNKERAALLPARTV